MTPHTARTYLRTLLAASLVCGLLLAAAVILVDPYGLFGTGLFPAVILTNRSQKIEALRTMDPAPEALIFGSSRMFRADPDVVQTRTGLRSYNASISYARPEEHLALLRVVMEDLHIKPRLIVVGINAAEFNHDPIDPQTITHPLLRKKLPITTTTYFRTIATTLKERVNPGMVRDLFTSLLFRFSAPPLQVTFLENGMRTPMESDTDNRTERLSLSVPGAINLYSTGNDLSPERVSHFRTFVSYAAAHGVRVHAIILPTAASTEAAIAQTSTYRAQLQELRALFTELAATTPTFTMTDGTSPGTYQADPDDFADATHPKETLLRTLLDFSLKQAGLASPPL